MIYALEVVILLGNNHLGINYPLIGSNFTRLPEEKRAIGSMSIENRMIYPDRAATNLEDGQ